MSDLIVFLTVFILGPIPVLHFILHGFLPVWRNRPFLFYFTGLVAWLASAAAASQILKFQLNLFGEKWLFLPAVILWLCSLALILWSIKTLTPRRFFLWAVLRPASAKQEFIKSGPYRYFPHPAYAGYVMASFASFLATGRLVLLIFAVYCAVSILIVIKLEEHELRKRLPHPSSPSLKEMEDREGSR